MKKNPLILNDLKSLSLTFEQPVSGYWDGGKKKSGIFTPTLHLPDDPKRSYIKWDCYELNHWFTEPLHTKTGRPLTAEKIMRIARKNLKTRMPSTITEGDL